VPVSEGVIRIGLVLHLAQPLGGLDRGWRVGVIQERGCAGEALVPHQLLGINPAVRLPERYVPLARNLTQCVIDRHIRDL
jgi:hypothetical protein